MKRRALAGVLPALVLLGACDIPATTPDWDMTWNVPAETSTLNVSSFLPAGVQFTQAGGPFAVTAAQTSVIATLGSYCGVCSGSPPIKPAFTGSTVVTTSLPVGLGTATLAPGSSIGVAIRNGFGFDLINPTGATSAGTLTITITNNNVTLGSVTLTGGPTCVSGSPCTITGVPDGQTTMVSVPLAGSVVGSSPVTITTTVNSPAGSSVPMNPSSTAVVQVFPFVSVSSATVTLNNQAVNSVSTLDLKSIDSTVSTRVDSGQFIVTATNPFAASGTLNITFTGGTQTITKTVALDAGGPTATPSTKTVSFTGPELRSLLGHTLTVTIGGQVSGAAVTVTPTQSVTVTTRLALTVSTKSST